MKCPVDGAKLCESVLDAVAKYLSITHATHKRRCAVRMGVREVTDHDVCECPHDDWDEIRQWCNRCGAGALDLLELRDMG